MDTALQAVASTLEKQQSVLSEMAKSHREMEKRMAENTEATRTAQILQEVQQGHGRATDQSMLHELRDRLSGFESILKRDRAEDGGLASTSSNQATIGSPTGTTAEVVVPEVAGGQNQVSDLISKLKKNAQTPQEVFVDHLSEYAEEDKNAWAAIFPPGFRARVAPNFLGEIYNSGKNAKAWSKEFVKTHNIGDFNEARDLIPTCAAIDAVLLQDRQKGAINSVALERLSKRAMGIVRGTENVWVEADWKEPSGGGKKGWRSKVDWEIWNRTDPSRGGKEDHVFANKTHEEEVRGEMDRDAALLKSRAKLAELGSRA